MSSCVHVRPDILAKRLCGSFFSDARVSAPSSCLRRHFTRRSLLGVLRDAGFQTAEVRAAGFPFFNLYRLAVFAAGGRLIRATQASGPPSRLARVAARLAAFGLKLNLPNAPFGWQLVGLGYNA